MSGFTLADLETRIANALGIDHANLNRIVAAAVAQFPDLAQRAEFIKAEIAKLIPEALGDVENLVSGFVAHLVAKTAGIDPEAWTGLG
jgi:hypothetical protein